MSSLLTETGIIVLLLLANGVFAMTELAVISARRSRLRHLAEQGDIGARAALELAESPTRFLSTVQIGITLVGILAGAFGGATIAEKIAEWLEQFPSIAPYGEGIGLTVVVVAISYCSLVLGELVPKRIALANPEGIASFLARPMRQLSSLARPVVAVLAASTEALIRLLGIRADRTTAVSEEEIRGLMREGVRAGAFHRVESQIVESALELDRLEVREIMTPRAKIIWIQQDDPHDSIWHKIVVSNHSSFPVYADNRDNVVGVIAVKAIYAHLAAGLPATVSDLMTKPLFVPATQNVLQLLETFKQTGKHIALVADEFGSVVGLVTLNDVMEAIVGDFPTQDERSRPAALRREDGSWLIDAMIEIEQVERALPGFHAGHGEERDYQTLAGYVVRQLGRVPREGETFEAQGYVFEVLDMDRHRVDKVLVMPLAPTGGPSAAPGATGGASPAAA